MNGTTLLRPLLALVLLPSLASAQVEETPDCVRLAEDLAEDMLPVIWEPAADAFARIAEEGQAPICEAAFDVISPVDPDLEDRAPECLALLTVLDDAAIAGALDEVDVTEILAVAATNEPEFCEEASAPLLE